MALNYVAVFAAALVSWLAGAVWYGMLGHLWMAALRWKPADLPPSPPVGPLFVSFLAEVVMAAALAALLVLTGLTEPSGGMILGAGCWLAFIATTIVVTNAFQQRPFALSLIDGGHWLTVLLLQGYVLGTFA